METPRFPLAAVSTMLCMTLLSCRPQDSASSVRSKTKVQKTTSTQPTKPREDFRKLVMAAFEQPRDECLATLTSLLGDAHFNISDEDMAWLFDLYLEEHWRERPRLSDNLWMSALSGWISNRPATAAEFLRSKMRLNENEGHLLMTVWASFAPLDAISWAKSSGDSTAAINDPNSVHHWLAYHSQQLTESWASHDLDGLLAWVSAGGKEANATTLITAFKTQRGMQAVSDWLEANGAALPPDIAAQAAKEIATDLSLTKGLAAAAGWVKNRIAPSEVTFGVEAVAPRFVKESPAQALDWLDSLSAKRGFPSRSAEQAINDWAFRDPGAAGDWVNAHRGSPISNSYVWGYAMQLALENPEAAKEWVKALDGKKGMHSTGGIGALDLIEKLDAPHLESMIEIASLAARTLNDPGQNLSLPADRSVNFLPYSPRLIKESDSAEPRLQMIRRDPMQCVQIFQGSWKLPFPTYIRQPDGSLRYEERARL